MVVGIKNPPCSTTVRGFLRQVKDPLTIKYHIKHHTNVSCKSYKVPVYCRCGVDLGRRRRGRGSGPDEFDILINHVLGKFDCRIILTLFDKVAHCDRCLFGDALFVLGQNREDYRRKLGEVVVQLGDGLIELFKAHAGLEQVQDELGDLLAPFFRHRAVGKLGFDHLDDFELDLLAQVIWGHENSIRYHGLSIKKIKIFECSTKTCYREPMAEFSGGDRPKTKMPVRAFLRLMTAAPAVLAGAALGVKVGHQEAIKIKEGWFEQDGVRYFPLYEAHSVGPTKELPKEADALFCEENVQQNEVGLTIYNIPASVLAEILPRYAGKEIPGKRRLLDAATQQKIPIALGDVRGDPAFEQKISIAEIERALGIVDKADRQRFWSGIMLGVITQLPDKLRKPLLWRASGHVSRRDFLGLAASAFGATALGLSGISLGTWAATDTQYFKGMLENPDYPPGVAELLNRLGSFASNIHPEDAPVFLGDLFMAHKIAQVGDWMKKDKKLPMVAYNVGARHNGIENMLLLSADMRRLLMANVHKQLVGKMKEEYGFSLATTRVIQADDKGEYENVALLPDEKLMDMLGIEKPAG